jgi:hypothetical protein
MSQKLESEHEIPLTVTIVKEVNISSVDLTNLCLDLHVIYRSGDDSNIAKYYHLQF